MPKCKWINFLNVHNFLALALNYSGFSKMNKPLKNTQTSAKQRDAWASCG